MAGDHDRHDAVIAPALHRDRDLEIVDDPARRAFDDCCRDMTSLTARRAQFDRGTGSLMSRCSNDVAAVEHESRLHGPQTRDQHEDDRGDALKDECAALGPAPA